MPEPGKQVLDAWAMGAEFEKTLTKQLDELKGILLEFHEGQMHQVFGAATAVAASRDRNDKEDSPKKLEPANDLGQTSAMGKEDLRREYPSQANDSDIGPDGTDSMRSSEMVHDLTHNESRYSQLYRSPGTAARSSVRRDADMGKEIKADSSRPSQQLTSSHQPRDLSTEWDHITQLQRSTRPGTSRGEVLKRISSALSDVNVEETSCRLRVSLLVYHPWFGSFISYVIVANAAVICVQTQWNATNLGESEPVVFELLNHVCNAIFFIELLLRIFSQRYSFFTDWEWKWNFFDAFIVFVAFVETMFTIFDWAGLQGGTVVRTFRMLRLVRSIRAIRSALIFRELRLVVSGILASMACIFWLLFLLLLIMLIMGTYITQVVTHQRIRNAGKQGSLDEYAKFNEENFSTLPKAIYSLFQVISAGANWGEYCNALYAASPTLGFTFTLYISFVVFAFLNVVTGVFVDNAQKAADEDVDFVVLDATEKQRKHIDQVVKVFKAADLNGDGTLSPEEFEAHVADPRVQAYFKFIQLDFEAFGPERLFQLLDFDGGGILELGEFITGCSKFRGRARSLDLAAMHHDVRKLDRKIVQLLDNISQSISRSEQRLSSRWELRRLQSIGTTNLGKSPRPPSGTTDIVPRGLRTPPQYHEIDNLVFDKEWHGFMATPHEPRGEKRDVS